MSACVEDAPVFGESFLLLFERPEQQAALRVVVNDVVSMGAPGRWR